MKSKRIGKKVGIVTDEIAKNWYIEEQTGKPIIQYLDLYKHIAKHAEQFISIDSFNYTMDHVVEVINTPDYVFFNYCEPEGKIALEYYKFLMENVVIIVHITKKRELEIASIYPVTETKINNRKLKEDYIKEKILLDNYSVKDDSMKEI